MRRGWLLLAVIAIVGLGTGLGAVSVYAQDEEDILRQAEDAAARADVAVERAEALTDFAFNLLGIFEAISVAVTIAGAALGAVGFVRLINAQNSLTKAREEVEDEIKKIRQQFNDDLERRNHEFELLRQQLQAATDQVSDEAANATLATALLSFGERQYKATDLNGAINTYKRAVELDDNNPVSFYRLGYVYSNKGELNEAEQQLRKSLQIDEDFDPAKATLGFVYRRKGEKMPEGLERERTLNEAERWMQDALSTSPKLVDEDGESWWGALGGLYKRKNQIAEAIRAYERAAAVTPNSSYPFGNLATLYGEQKDIERMLQMYRRVARLAAAEVQAEVGNYWGYFDLLTAYLVIEKRREAEEILPIVLETVPPDAVYAFDALITTLKKVAISLEDYPQGQHLLEFAERVEAYKARREANPDAFVMEDDPTGSFTLPKPPPAES